jgi:hexulose-6-phosphate isomerase
VHLKDFRVAAGGLEGFVMLLEGDVNWPAVMQALREIDYNRALTAEFGPYKYSLEAMLDHVIAAQRRLLAL